MPKFYSMFMKAVITHPECSIRYEVFLTIFLKIFSPQFEQGKELGIESARIITQLNEIIKIEPNHIKSLNLLGDIYIKLNKPKESLHFVNKALNIEKYN